MRCGALLHLLPRLCWDRCVCVCLACVCCFHFTCKDTSVIAKVKQTKSVTLSNLQQRLSCFILLYFSSSHYTSALVFGFVCFFPAGLCDRSTCAQLTRWCVQGPLSQLSCWCVQVCSASQDIHGYLSTSRGQPTASTSVEYYLTAYL